jgi:tetratricopeptide (TPR) repeat protein
MLRVPSQAVPLTIAIAVAVLALGSVTQHGLLAAGVTTAVAAVAAAWSPPRVAASRGARIVSIAAWSLVGWEFLQLVPLPPRLLRLLTPRGAEIWQRGDALLGSSGSWHPISIDPPGTLTAVATAIVVALIFHVSVRVARHEGGRGAMLEGLALVTVVFALITLAHVLFGVTQVYGWYAPRATGYPLIGPLLNPNHAAAVAAVGPPLFLGLAPRRHSAGGTVLAWLGVAVTAIVTVLSLSRGGIAVLAAEFVAMAALLLADKKSAASTRAAPAVIAGVVILAVTYVALEPVLREITNTDVSKLRLAQAGYSIARDFPLVGTGRGTFGALSSAYTTALGGSSRYAFAEHWPAQLAAELGVPVTLALLGAIVVAVVPTFRIAVRAPHTAGAVVALLGLVAHDLADFAMEFAGTAMIAAALLGVLLSESEGHAARMARSRSRRAFEFWSPIGGTALFAIAITASWNRRLEDTTFTIRELGVSADAAAAARIAMARHPGEAYFPMIVGAASGPTAEAGGFLSHAIRLAPARAAPHYWMARWFWSTGRRAQAYAEYRSAGQLDADLWFVVASELLRADAPIAELSALATTANHVDYLVPRLLTHGRTADAEILDQRALIEFPQAPGAYGREVARARASGDSARARRVAEAWITATPNAAGGYAALAELMPAAEAEPMLNEALGRLGDDPSLVAAWLRVRAASTDELNIHDIDRLRNALVSHGQSVHLTYGVLGEIAASKGRKAAALRHFKAAATASPDGVAYLEQAANLAQELGDWNGAADAWEKLAAANPDEPRFARRARDARKKASASPSVAAPP